MADTITVARRSSPMNDDGANLDRQPEDGMALCLSGGGYRAMLFHLGVVWRFLDAGLLLDLKRISSVSGGSITAGVLGWRWAEVTMGGVPGFVDAVVGPVRRLAGRTIDAGSILGGLLLPGMISDHVAAAYREHLFGGQAPSLQDLPDDDAGPRFVINAANVQSGALWRFSRPYMGDWRVGRINEPDFPLATAIAASSAFPPVLSPAVLNLEGYAYAPGEASLTAREFRERVVLTDGGVYDNMGIETAWKRWKTVFVADAGAKMTFEAEPKEDWARHAKRVLDVIDNQVRSLRKRQVVGEFAKGRPGAYWSIGGTYADYAPRLACDQAEAARLAATPTRLEALSSQRQEKLINWGYAMTDAALRKWYPNPLSNPGGFPYPASGV